MDIILKLHEAGKLEKLTVVDLREKIERQNVSPSFFAYTNQIIEQLKQANRLGTALSYKGVLNILKGYGGDKELCFDDIDYKFLTKIEISHSAKGNSYNGLAVYIRTIRAIFNKAAKDGVFEKTLYPFADYKIRTVPTENQALDGSLLKRIIDLKLKEEDSCFNARNFFVASFMMYGMNFTDMAFLQRSNTVNNRIQYRRRKLVNCMI